MSSGDWNGLLAGGLVFAVVGVLIAIMAFREGARKRRNARAWAEIAEKLSLVAWPTGVSGHWHDTEVSAEHRGGELSVRAKTRGRVVGSYPRSPVVFLPAGVEQGEWPERSTEVPPRIARVVRETMLKAADWSVLFHHGTLVLSRKSLDVDSSVSDAIRSAAEACASMDAQQNYRDP